MANTIMTAKNTFGDGLVLDISPENTGANNLSSALNATLITANGNEMTLQNDMGNARVETAYLPDGYIPIGTCEFGDIIYIVSYNPLVNKAQIGCFPSPERNISSEEISNMVQTLQASDFQVLEDGKPTGELKAMQIKKTLFDGKKLRPGDKYIIYTRDNTDGDAIDDPTNFFTFTSQYGAPSANDLLPRLVKLRIASTDSEGKLTYLDTQTKWYNGRNTMEKYFVAFLQDSVGRPDIDSYRDLTNSAYSVFQNKNAGNLVLVAELEKIDSFSCSYSVIKSQQKQEEEGKTNFNVYLHVSWDTPHNDINPFGIRVTGDAEGLDFENGIFEKSISRLYKPDEVNKEEDDLGNIIYKPYSYEEYKNNNYESKLLTQLLWNNDIPMNKISLAQTLDGDYLFKDSLAQYYPNLTKLSKEDNEIKAYTTNSLGADILIEPIAFSADVVNNYFKKDYTIHLASVTYTNDALPVWNIMVYPCMPYGYLEHLGVPLTIDFSKVGTNAIELTHWKYYNEGLLSTLTYGFDAHLANNYKVKQVAFKFYDDRGLVAVYKSNEKTSYSGMFTERFGLNGENLNYKLSNIDLNGKLIYHAGSLSSEEDVQLGQDGTSELKPSLKPGQEVQPTSNMNDVTYLNDSGVLYTNKLYGVKIIVEYGVVNELGEMINTETKDFYRWYWTNNMFNDKYFQQNDFNFDSITLGLGCNYVLQSTGDFKTKQVAYYNGNIGAGVENLPETLGADTTYIAGPMSLKLDVGLSENYSTFIPSTDLQVGCKIGLGYKNIIQSYSEIASEEGTNIANTKRLTPNINLSNDKMWDNKGDILLELLGIEEGKGAVEIWNTSEDDKSYASQFVLTLNGDNTDSDKYMFNDVEYDVYYEDDKTLTSGKQTEVELQLEGISFDKVMYSGIESIPKNYPIVESLWSSDAFKEKLGIKSSKYKDASNNEYDIHYFTDVLAITTPTSGHDGILKKCIYGDPISNPSITEHKDRQVTTENKNYQYNNSELLSAIDKLGFTGPIILLSWFAGSGDKNGKDQESFAIDGHIINGNGGGYSQLPDITSSDTKSFFNNTGAFFQLALYKPNTYLYLLNDVINYFTEENSENQLPQIPIINGFDSGNSEKIEYKKAKQNQGLADILVKVFSNIYYKSYQTSEVELPKFTDLAYANNFKEIWNQHLILNINQPKEENDKKMDYSGKINLLGSIKANSEYYTVSDYIKKINDFTNDKMPDFKILLAQALQVIDCNIDVPSSRLLKNIYSRKTSEPQAVWFKDGDKKDPLYVYSNVNDTLFQESNGELTKLSKNFTYKISPEETAICNLSWLEYDSEIFIKADNYPKGNYYRIGNGYTNNGKLLGYRYYENASKDATITGFWNVIK